MAVNNIAMVGIRTHQFDTFKVKFNTITISNTNTNSISNSNSSTTSSSSITIILHYT